MPVPVSSQIDKVSGLKSPDINSANCDSNNEISQIPSSAKYNIDGKNNHGRRDLMDSIVTIKMNGKEHPKGNIRMMVFQTNILMLQQNYICTNFSITIFS